MVLHGIVSEIRVLSSDIKSLVVVWNFSNGDLESLQRRFWRAMPGGHQRVVPTAPGSLFPNLVNPSIPKMEVLDACF